MASAVDSRLAYARLSAVATASRLPTATRGSNNSYTTSWDTTFHRWADTQRRYRFRLSALALAVAVPAFFMLGVLLEQQFQIVPLHDPTSGWSAHIWQNYGRTIVDCAEDARRTNKAIECRFPVRAP